MWLPALLLSRLSFWKTSFYLDGVVAVGTLSLYGTFALLRDEVFPSSQLLKEIVVIPLWPWWLWTILILIVIIGCAYEGTYRRYAVLKLERDDLNRQINELKTPKLAWEWRPDNTRYLIRDSERETSVIYLRNTSMMHVEKIEMFCDDAVSLTHGDYVLILNPNMGAPPLRLSRREPVPVRILLFEATRREITCLLPYRNTQHERLPGKLFSLKFMIVGTTPSGLAIESPRILARFGIDHSNRFFVTYEEANPEAQ